MDIQSVREIALALPEVTEAPHFHYASFRGTGKIFVTVPPGEEYIHVFLDEQERQQALALYAGAVEPLHWGKKVVEIRVNLAQVEPEAVEQLVRAAWRTKAPKSLVAVAGQDRPAV